MSFVASAIADLDVDRERLAEICERYGIVELDVFGSTARGDGTAESDIDLLYVLAPARSLGFGINRLEDELSALLERPVDLVSKRSLHPRLRDRAIREAKRVYAA